MTPPVKLTAAMLDDLEQKEYGLAVWPEKVVEIPLPTLVLCAERP